MRLRAIRALGELAPESKEPIGVLRKALAEQDDEIRLAAIEALGRCEASGAHRTLLLELRKDQSPVIRKCVARGFEANCSSDRELVALNEMLKDPDDGVRFQVALSLKALDQDNSNFLPILIATLTGENLEGRLEAAGALAEVGSSARAALPGLRKMLSEKDADAREAAAFAIWRIERQARVVLPVFIDILKQKKNDDPFAGVMKAIFTGQKVRGPSWQAAALKALAEIGPEAAPAVPILIEILSDTSSTCGMFRNWQVVDALCKIGPEGKKAIPLLKEQLKNDDGLMRLTAASGLWRMGQASPAFEAALTALRGVDWEMRFAAVRVLGEMGPGAKTAVPDLAKLLDRPDFRREAIETFGKIGPDAKSQIPSLQSFLRDKEGTTRIAAALALWRIERDTNTTLTRLTRELGAADYGTRRAALEALKAMGQEAKPALDAILPLLKDKDPSVRKDANEALKSIDPQGCSARSWTRKYEIKPGMARREVENLLGGPPGDYSSGPIVTVSGGAVWWTEADPQWMGDSGLIIVRFAKDGTVARSFFADGAMKILMPGVRLD